MREQRKRFHKEREKALLRESRKLDELRAASWKAEYYEEVNPPIRVGWQRKLVYREDVRYWHNYADLKQCLDLVEEVQRSRRKDFKVYDWRKRKYVEREFPSLSVSEEAYNKKVPKNLKSYFVRTLNFSHGFILCEYKFMVKPWMLKFKVEPWMIRSRAVYNDVVKSEYSKLSNKWYRNRLWTKLSHYKGYSYNDKEWRGLTKQKMLRKVHEQEMKEALDNWEKS